MKLFVYTIFTVFNFVNCAIQQLDITSPETIPDHQKKPRESLVQSQPHLGTLNDIKFQREEEQHDHTLAILDYIEGFNNGSFQDPDEINKRLAIQNHLKTLDDSYSSQQISQHEPDTTERDIKLLNLLKTEFVKNYRKNEGRWPKVAELAPEQRVELCKDAFRREHDVETVIFYEAAPEFRTMEVAIENAGQLYPDLLKCTVNTSIAWNAIVFPKREVFYLAEAGSPTIVFKLVPLEKNNVQVVGKIGPVKYQ